MKMSEDQKIKLLLLGMAEVLQVQLDEKRLRLYANALADLGSEGLERAMAQLLADPDVRPGHMLMPGKIREMAGGRIADQVQEVVMQILCVCRDVSNPFDWRNHLSPIAWDVARSYGLKAIEECSPDAKPTMVAQLRDMARASLVSSHRAIATSAALTHGRGQNLAIQGILESPIDSDGQVGL